MYATLASRDVVIIFLTVLAIISVSNRSVISFKCRF